MKAVSMTGVVVRLSICVLFLSIWSQGLVAKTLPRNTRQTSVKAQPARPPLLDQARKALAAGDFAQAEALFRSVVELSKSNSDDRRDAEASLQRVLVIRRHMLQLDRVERLIAERQDMEAQTLADKVVADAIDGRVIERAGALSEKANVTRLSLVEQARRSLAAGHLAQAESQFRSAAELYQPGSEGRRDADASVQRVLQIRRQMLELDRAERLIAERQQKAGQALLDKVISEAVDDRVIERAGKLSTTSQPAQPPLLDQARKALAAGDFAQAEALFESAAESSERGSDARAEADASLTRVLQTRRQMLQLDRAERLTADRQRAEARTLLDKVVSETAVDGRVIERARTLLLQAEPAWWESAYDKTVALVSGVAPYLLLIALVIILAFLSRLLNKLWTVLVKLWAYARADGHQVGDKWVLAEIADSTGQGAGALVSHYFSYWVSRPPVAETSGLLMLEASRIPHVPGLPRIAESNFDFANQLQSTKITVAGIEIGAMASLGEAFRRTFWPRQEIRGTVYVLDKRVCAHLRASYRAKWWQTPRRPLAVSAFANKDSPECVRTVAEEVTLKMLYALEKKDANAGERANELRLGLEKLREYLAGIQPDDRSPSATLEEARKVFEHVRKAQPDSFDAYMYEGIALDLLERHEDAIATFAYARSLATGHQQEDKIRRQRATYNEAVANLRNLYQLVGIDRCIKIIDELTGPNPDFAKMPLMALALATKADALANRIIHWRDVPNSEIGHDPRAPQRQKLDKLIRKHVDEVRTICGRLLAALPASGSGTGWDADTIRQLKWAIHNAEADLYLYASIAMTQVDVSQSPEFKSFEIPTDQPEFQSYVDMALKALRECEILLPAGVETLTNLGTLYLVKGQPGDLVEARRFFARAIALNPHYEYAYYRLAQCWEKDRWRERVIETLQSCPVPPRIPTFRRMFELYYVQPKSEYPKLSQSPG
jgi:tetratricopeptide (TPR) repeat protein